MTRRGRLAAESGSDGATNRKTRDAAEAVPAKDDEMPARKTTATEAVATEVPATANGEAKRKVGVSTIEGGGAFAPDAITFGTPPTNSRGRGSSHKWGAVIDVLKARPGEWGKLGVWGSNGNRPKPLKDAGIEMKTAAVTLENGDKAYELWGMFPKG